MADLLRITIIERSKIFSKDFELTISNTVSYPFGSALYVIPWYMVQELQLPNVGIGSNLIAFGPSKHLSLAIAEGAADYMHDPWDIEELYYRSMRILGYRERELSWADVFANGMEARINGVELTLTRGQQLFFQILVSNAGKVLGHEVLLAALGIRNRGSRVLSVYASDLRRHISGIVGFDSEKILIGCYGHGYGLKA